jgi:hypothetical protein
MTNEPPTEPTTEKLARALEDAGAPSFMIVAARHGAYDDYKSASATPEVDLLNQARRYNLQTIVEGVMEGRWDATKEESDAWAASPDGQATLGQLYSGLRLREVRRGPARAPRPPGHT